MVWGWESVNRDGYRNQKARMGKGGGGKKNSGCGKKAAALLIWGSISGYALVNAIAQSLG